jgi:dipeptidyl aminopeptidase/acylaminoacyl peptidase
VLFATSILACLAPLAAADTHPFSIHDMLAMDRISDTQVSPNGRQVLFTVRVTDVEANKGRTDLWLANVDGTGVRRLTTHDASDTSGRWSADGTSIFFLSTRSGSSQLWMLPLVGGEATQMTHVPLDVEGFVPFGDDKRFVLALDVYPDLPRDKVIHETVVRDAAKDASKVKARIYDSLMIRHWDTWEDGKRSHLFAWNSSEGDPIDLMSGVDGDAPTKPFGGIEEVAITPDGTGVVFACQLATRDMAWSTNVDLWYAPIDGSTKPVDLTADNKATDTHPAFSPDGTKLAYLRMSRAGYESDRMRIAILDWKTRASRVLTEAWDRSAGDITWSSDGKTIWTTADNLGQKSIFSIDTTSGAAKVIVDQGTCDSPALARDRLVFTLDTLKGPAEIMSVAFDGTGVAPITKLNAAKVAAARMGDYEQFSFKGAHGDTVYGYLVKPIDFDASKKYPVAFLIHGGPQGSFGNHFHYRWNPQAYAGAGYAAIMIDFHASTGYGQAFVDAVNHDWGGAPYEDLMKGLDFALSKYTFLDSTRMGALGASFGGYMINWVAGNTDRFRCLVNHDGNIDERMAYYDTEELWFPEWEHGGTPWENPEGYTKHNPIDLVKNWKTPMLVVHGGQDFRVVETQGMSTFTALQRKGIPSKFLYFPDENHWVLKPQNSILWHETVLAWLDRFTKSAGG